MIFSGLTANTAKHLQLDAGAFVKNFDKNSDTWETAKSKVIGATDGGGSFAAVPTIRRIPVDGTRGNTKGFQALDDWTVTLTANVKEITAETLSLALATGKDSLVTISGKQYTSITAATELQDSDYKDNITWIGRISGSQEPIIIIVKNALATNGLTLSFADKSEGKIPATITGHFDDDALDEPPFEILYPPIV